MNYSDYVSQQVLSPLSNQGECSGMGNQTHKILVECLRAANDNSERHAFAFYRISSTEAKRLL